MLLTDRAPTDRRLPALDIDLPKLDLDLPKVDIAQATADLGQAVSSAVSSVVAATPIRRRSRSTPWPVGVVGFVVVGVTTWLVLSNESVRRAIADMVMAIRHRFDVLLTGTASPPIDPVAFDATADAAATSTAPIDPDALPTDPLYTGMTDDPDGLGTKGAARRNGEAVKIR